MTTTRAPVAADRHLQHRGTPPQRLVRQPTLHRSPRDPFAAAAPAPPVGFHNACEDRTIGLEPLTDGLKTELVESAEGGQVRAGEASTSGSIRHVGVFQRGSVRTSIIGRPRPLSGHRRAGPPRDVRYTLIWEEPYSFASGRGSRGRSSIHSGRLHQRILRPTLSSRTIRPRKHYLHEVRDSRAS